MFRLDKNNEVFVQYRHDPANPASLSGDTILAIQEDKRGNLWIGTSWSGLRIWNRKSGEYLTIKHDSQDADSLDDDNVTSILKDASGVMWVGTTRGGINKCLSDQVKFPHYKHNRYDPQSISRFATAAPESYLSIRCLLF